MRCLSLKLALRPTDMSSSISGSSITLRAIGFGSGLEWQVLGSLGSNLSESESPSEAWTELSAELDVEGVEVDGDLGTRVEALVTFMLGLFFFFFFLFFLVGGQVAGDEVRPFSPDALLNFPSCIFSSRCSRCS